MPTRYLEVIQPKSKFATWAWSPIIVLRVALVSTYLLYVCLGIVTFWAAIPVLSLVTPQGYIPIWGAILGGSAVLSAIGSTRDKWQKLEKWASMMLSAMALSLIILLLLRGFLEGKVAVQVIGIITLIAGVLPITRFVYLAAQSGKKKHNADTRPGE